jgi:hypothetical protein
MNMSEIKCLRKKNGAKRLLMLAAVAILMIMVFTACCDQSSTGDSAGDAANSVASSAAGDVAKGADVNTRSYTITKISGLPEWDKIPKLDVDNVLWEPDAGIRAYGQLCYDDDVLYVHLGAKEKDIRAENKKPLSAVNEDSCLELFFMPEGGDRYLNFEVNPNGCMHYQVGRDRTDRLSLYREDEKRFFDIKTDRTKDGWEVFYTFPVEVIRVFFPGYTLKSGMKIYANSYKCGDETVKPHFIAWNPVDVVVPSFHEPEHFGLMVLE